MARRDKYLDFELNIEFNLRASPQLQEVGKKYWQPLAVWPDNQVKWRHPRKDLDFQTWSKNLYIAAAAGVTASTPTFFCAKCANFLTLRSRNTLEDARKGKPVECRACDQTIDNQAEAILRDEDQAQRRGRIPGRLAPTKLEARRSANDFTTVGFDAKIGALAIVEAAQGADGWIYPFSPEGQSIAPRATLTLSLFEAARRADLLYLHPSSPLETYALPQEGRRERHGNQFNFERAQFTVPGGGPVAFRNRLFTHRLRKELSFKSLLPADRKELVVLLRQLITEEAVNYLRFRLADLNLSGPAEQDLARLRLRLAEGAKTISLIELSQAIFSVTKRVKGYKWVARQRAAHFCVEGVLEYVDRLSEERMPLTNSKQEHLDVVFSTATKIVFEVVLGLDPTTATSAEIATALTATSDKKVRGTWRSDFPKVSELRSWLLTSTTWSPPQLREALDQMSTRDHDYAAGASRDIASRACRFFDRASSDFGEEDAARMTVNALSFGSFTGNHGRSGDFVLVEVVHLLGGI